MSRERCVFCMEEIKEGAVCPACHKGIWEYDWKEEWLEPYTILKEKYLVGAVSMAGTDFVRYIGYDLILEQKVWLRVYSKDAWKEKGKKRQGSCLENSVSLGFPASETIMNRKKAVIWSQSI